MAMTRKQLSRACRKAADVIQKDGFMKGDFGTSDGPKCAVGAIRFVVSGSPRRELDVEEGVLDLNTLYQEARPRARMCRTLVQFNDADRTRKHDVVQLLRDMAALAAG